jgi:TRAP-type uncharacterized transport system substrate-binding protein
MKPPARRALLTAALAATAATAGAQTNPGMTPAAPPANPGTGLSGLTARANAGTVGVVSGGVDGTYVRIAADLAAVLDGPELRVLPIIGKGSLQNIEDIILLRGIDVGIVQSDTLAVARRRRRLPGIENMIQYIAKLYDEEVHVLARDDIGSMRDLAGQPVNIDLAPSGTAMTASLIFEGLGIAPRFTNDPQDTALEKLRRGEIKALTFVAGKPARLFANIQPGSGLKFLTLPATPTMLETYLPSALAAADYPALIPAGTTVETLAVGAVMAVYAWQPGTERHRKVARFVETFQARFGDFLRPPRHPKWREVNLAAELPGWVRFDPAPPQPVRRRGIPASGG